MSVRVMSWVFDKAPTTNPTDQLVLLAIADRCNDDGLEAWPSIETLSKKTRLSERGVWGALQRLRRAGVLRIQGGKGRNRSNRYEVLLAERPSSDLAPGATSHDVRDDVAPRAGKGRTRCESELAPRANDPSSTSSTSRTKETHAYELAFDSHFWPAYPRKTARKHARRAFLRLRPEPAMLERMLAALEQQKASAGWRDPLFIPHAATWLNGERWLDDVPVAHAPVGRTGAPAAGKYAHLADDGHGLERAS